MKIVKLTLAILLLFMFCTSSFAAVKVNVKGKSISAKTSLKGESGIKGCEITKRKKVSAYVYELMYLKPVSNKACDANSKNDWKRIAMVPTSMDEIDFNNLPAGKYKVIVKVGEAKGCEIKICDTDETVQSIIQKIEKSDIVTIKADPPRLPVTISSSIPDDEKTNSLTSQNLHVYPNPTSDFLNLEFKDSKIIGELQVNLVNLIGQSVFSKVFTTDDLGSENFLRINLSLVAEGTHLLILEDEAGNRSVHKVLILKEQFQNQK